MYHFNFYKISFLYNFWNQIFQFHLVEQIYLPKIKHRLITRHVYTHALFVIL